MQQQIQIKKSRETLKILSDKLESNQPFHYIRMGDGRILMAGGRWGGEGSDHFRNEKLVIALRKILGIIDSDFLIGLHVDVPEEEGHRTGSFANYRNNDELRGIVKDYTVRTDFEHPAPMHYLALYDRNLVIDFFVKLRNKKVVVVGGKHLEGMKEFDFVDDFVITPDTDAFEQAEYIHKLVLEKKPDIILTACGACSHVLQYWTFQTETNITTIDIGSFADLVIGLDTRQYIHDNKERVDEFIELFNYIFKENEGVKQKS